MDLIEVIKRNRELPLEEVKFCVVDTETTGLEKTARVHQLGAVILHKGGVFEAEGLDLKFNIFADDYEPERMIEGYDYHELHEYPTFIEEWPEIENFMEDCVIVAQNEKFDRARINYELEIGGIDPMKGKMLDLVNISKMIYPEEFNDSANLDVVAGHLNLSISDEERHTALPDAILTAYCLEALLNEWQCNKINSLGELLEGIGFGIS